MSDKIGVLKFNWLGGPMTMTEELVEGWRPRGCKTEKDFENSLFRSLRSRLDEDIPITKQYGVGRAIVDIVVNEEVAVEMKVNFKSTASLTRLLGQTDIMLDKFEKIIVVLCGQKDKALVQTLALKLEEKDGGIFSPHITLITK